MKVMLCVLMALPFAGHAVFAAAGPAFAAMPPVNAAARSTGEAGQNMVAQGRGIFPRHNPKKDEQAVAAAVEALRKQLLNPDKAKLQLLTFDELTYGHSSGLIQNKAEFIEALVSGQSDFVSVDLSGQTIRVMDKTAIVRHILTAATNDGGKPGQVKLSVLLVWQKQKGQWKLLARQAVKAA